MGKDIRLFASGLPLALEPNENTLVFGSGIKKTEAKVRFFGDLQSVLAETTSDSLSKPAYFMYRDLCLEKDSKKIEESGLRYDITVIPPAVIGKEFVKTFGHSHPMVNGGSISFPEVYEVIRGRGHFVLQGKAECFIVEAKEGEKVLIGPNLLHATINPFNETLVLANWVERNFESDYSLAAEKKGMAFYETTDGFVKNPHYTENFSLKFLRTKEVKELGLVSKKPMYELVHEIKKLEFLKNPQGFERVFEDYFSQKS